VPGAYSTIHGVTQLMMDKFVFFFFCFSFRAKAGNFYFCLRACVRLCVRPSVLPRVFFANSG
jgi:hypothetical protein